MTFTFVRTSSASVMCLHVLNGMIVAATGHRIIAQQPTTTSERAFNPERNIKFVFIRNNYNNNNKIQQNIRRRPKHAVVILTFILICTNPINQPTLSKSCSFSFFCYSFVYIFGSHATLLYLQRTKTRTHQINTDNNTNNNNINNQNTNKKEQDHNWNKRLCFFVHLLIGFSVVECHKRILNARTYICSYVAIALMIALEQQQQQLALFVYFTTNKQLENLK